MNTLSGCDASSAIPRAIQTVGSGDDGVPVVDGAATDVVVEEALTHLQRADVGVLAVARLHSVHYQRVQLQAMHHPT